MIAYAFLLIGLLLLFLEFYTPGGVLAISGIICMLFSVGFYISTSTSFLDSIFFVLIALVLTGVVVWLALYRIKKSASKNTFYLGKDQEGYQAASFDEALIGKRGTAQSDLGPSGFVVIEGVRYPARSRGGYIDKGRSIVVIGGEGAHIIVKEEAK